MTVALLWLLRATRWRRATSFIPAVLQLPNFCLNGYCRPISPLSSSQWIHLAAIGLKCIPLAAKAVEGTPVRHTPSAAVQSHLNRYCIDVPRVVKCYPPIASYPVERVERITSYLAGLGVDVRRAVEYHPSLLGGQVEAYEPIVQLLQANGVDVARVLNTNPGVLKRRVATVQQSIDTIASCGHSVADVLRNHPAILRSSAANISSIFRLREYSRRTSQTLTRDQSCDPKVVLLASLGLDDDWLLKRGSRLVNCSFDKLHTGVSFLEGLDCGCPPLNRGGLAMKVVRHAPTVLALRPENIQQRVDFFSKNGLDVKRHVNTLPKVLYFSVERKLQPMLAFILE
eukprot:EG_transcript_18872